MIPSPMKAIVLIRSSFSCLWLRGRAALRSWYPLEGVRSGRLVLQAHISPVALLGHLLEVGPERDFAGFPARLAGRIGNLHVADLAAVIVYCGR